MTELMTEVKKHNLNLMIKIQLNEIKLNFRIFYLKFLSRMNSSEPTQGWINHYAD